MSIRTVENFVLWFGGIERQEGPATSLPLRGFKDCLKRAKHSIKDVSGSGTWFGDQEVFDIIKTQLEDNPKLAVEFVVGPSSDVATMKRYQELGVAVWVLPYRPNIHFSVIDKSYTRTEAYHEEEAQWRVQYVNRHNPIASSHHALFESLKEDARLLGENVELPPEARITAEALPSR